MTKSELLKLKENALSHKDKARDMDVIVAEISKLPYGQAKKGADGESAGSAGEIRI